VTARRTSAVSIAATVVVAMGILTGCAGSAPDLAAATATRLQADVLAVSKASAAGNLSRAHNALNALTKHVNTARKANSLSAARQDRIKLAIALVTADLTALDAQAAADAADKAAANQAADDQAAADQAAADAAAQAAEDAAKAARAQQKQDKKNADANKSPTPTPTVAPTTTPTVAPTTAPTVAPTPTPTTAPVG